MINIGLWATKLFQLLRIKAPTVILPKLEHEARERNVCFFGFVGLPAP